MYENSFKFLMMLVYYKRLIALRALPSARKARKAALRAAEAQASQRIE